MPSDSHNPLPVSDDARVRELEAEVDRLREALKEIAKLDVDSVTGLAQEPSGWAAVRLAREALEASSSKAGPS